MKIIDRAGIREMFEKENFTFLGPTNITIRKWFYWDKDGGVGNTDKEYVIHGYKSIQRVPVEICRKIVLSHVIEGIVSRDDIARGTYNRGTGIGGRGKYLYHSLGQPGVVVDDTGTLYEYSRDGTGYREYGVG